MDFFKSSFSTSKHNKNKTKTHPGQHQPIGAPFGIINLSNELSLPRHPQKAPTNSVFAGSRLFDMSAEFNLFSPPKDAAPIKKQKQWNSFSEKKKQNLRKQHRDTDKDGVPDIWDCQPRNPFKQDRYVQEELDEIKSFGEIELGAGIGRGGSGSVYNIKAKNASSQNAAANYVVKVSNAASNYHEHVTRNGAKPLKCRHKSFEKCAAGTKYDDGYLEIIEYEYEDYHDQGYEDMSLILPVMPVRVKVAGGKTTFGLLEPKVDVKSERLHLQYKDDPKDSYKTTSQEEIRQVYDGMQQLTNHGVAVWDFIQGGTANRPHGVKYHIFDTGAVSSPQRFTDRTDEDMVDRIYETQGLRKKYTKKELQDKQGKPDVYKINNAMWGDWIVKVRKYNRKN